MGVGDGQVVVWCDNCSNEEWFEMTALAMRGAYDTRNVRKDAERMGWHFANDDGLGGETFCADCWEDMARAESAE